MPRYLITGAGGFVGRLLLEYYDILDDGSTEILALDSRFPERMFTPQRCRCRFENVDLRNRNDFEKSFDEFRPDFLIHLAASSSVAESWREPEICVSNNLGILLNILETLRNQKESKNAKICRLLAVGSSEVYDNACETDEEKFSETAPLLPSNPYGVGRLAQEHFVRIYVENFGLDIVSTRSFAHTGPGQSETFAVASFVRQMLDAKDSGKVLLKTGNVDLIRDYSDVRDVVRAYDLLLKHGKTGEIYNVCRGEGHSLRSIINRIARILDVEVEIEVDPQKLRPNDPKTVIGSPEKIQRETGWTARFSFDQTLRDMIRR